MIKISYSGYRFPPEIIQHAIWLYIRFTLSFRDVEDLLAERGIMVSYSYCVINFLRREPLATGVAQHGHRERVLTSAMINLLRIVAIELGTWRSVLGGGASGSITFGNGKFFEPSGVTRSEGGPSPPLGDQESVGRDAQRGVGMEAAPASSFLEIVRARPLV